MLNSKIRNQSKFATWYIRRDQVKTNTQSEGNPCLFAGNVRKRNCNCSNVQAIGIALGHRTRHFKVANPLRTSAVKVSRKRPARSKFDFRTSRTVGRDKKKKKKKEKNAARLAVSLANCSTGYWKLKLSLRITGILRVIPEAKGKPVNWKLA